MDAQSYYAALPKTRISCPILGTDAWEPLVEGDRYEMGIQTMIHVDSGFIATNPRPTEEALNAFYRDHYRDYYFSFPDPHSVEYRASKNFRVGQRRAAWLVEFLSRHIKDEELRVLDVGCADGLFLAALKKARPNIKKLVGVEPDPRYADCAIEASGADVFVGDINQALSQAAVGSERFDVVVVSHVLEHLCDPAQKVAAIAELLTDGGHLLIEVPNILSPCWKGKFMFHIGHINQFYPETLVGLVESVGLEVTDIFSGLHPADPWAMTLLAKKTKEPRKSLYRLPNRARIDRITAFIRDRSFLPFPGKEEPVNGRKARLKQFVRRLF